MSSLSWRLTFIGPGTIPRTRSGRASTLSSGRRHRIHGSFCARFPKKKFSLSWPTPNFVNAFRPVNAITINPSPKRLGFQKKYPGSALSLVAYFSMEFMLTEALPIYSGGLGNVAGDQMKAASNLGVPVVGIGLLYGQGYFRQAFDLEGNQQALFPVNDPGQLPIRPLRQTERRVVKAPDSVTGSEALASLLGGLCREDETLPSRHQRFRQ